MNFVLSGGPLGLHGTAQPCGIARGAEVFPARSHGSRKLGDSQPVHDRWPAMPPLSLERTSPHGGSSRPIARRSQNFTATTLHENRRTIASKD
jgi:hypothetical protein